MPEPILGVELDSLPPGSDAPKLIWSKGIDTDPAPNPQDPDKEEPFFTQALIAAKRLKPDSPLLDKVALENLCNNALLVEEYLVYCITGGMDDQVKECLTSLGLKDVIIKMHQARKRGEKKPEDYWMAEIGEVLMERKENVEAYVRKLELEGYVEDVEMGGLPQATEPPQIVYGEHEDVCQKGI